MKKLFFVNGLLLAALLEGGRIVKTSTDGVDYHTLVQHPKTDGQPEDAPGFSVVSTNYHQNGNDEFSMSKKQWLVKDKPQAARIIPEFDAYVETTSGFKKEYPQNIRPVEEETAE